MSAATFTPEGAVLAVRAQPRASRDEVCGVLNGALKIRLRAPPVEGKANLALVEFLAGAVGLPKRDVILLAGETARTKRVLLRGVEAARLRRCLPQLGV